MFVRLKKSSGTVNPIIQIVESFRENGKVKQRVLASLGSIKDERDLKRLKNLAENMITKIHQERTRQKSLFEVESVKIPVLNKRPARIQPNKQTKNKIEDIQHNETIYDGFNDVVEKLFLQTGFSDIRVHKPVRMAFDPIRIAKILVSQRFFEPSSKLRTFERRNDLGFDDLKLQHIYRGMDALLSSDEAFQKQAYSMACSSNGSIFKEKIECLFVDVTTLYFESVKLDELRKFGYSKDQKFHSVQIVLCLIVNSDGIPVAYEIFSGNTAEVSTFAPVVENLKKKFEVKNITMVCDRGLSSLDNIKKLQTLGIGYVSGCKIKHLSSSLKLNDLSTFEEFEETDEDEFKVKRLEHPKYPESDLIVTWSKKRSIKDRQDRDKLLLRLQSKLGLKNNKPRESSDKLKKIVTNSGYKQFIKIDGLTTSWEINEAAVLKAQQWDGFHAIAVSKKSNLETREALTQYRNLWKIEDAFRLGKSQLEMRPMFHWKPNRIKAHILICFISLFLERYLELQLRKARSSLTPDRIRYALKKIHSISFQDTVTGQCGVMPSKLTNDAKSIYKVLGLSVERRTRLI